VFDSFFNNSPKPSSHEPRLKKVVGVGIMVGGGAKRAWEVWSWKEEGRGGLKCIIGLGCPIISCPGEMILGCGGG